MKFIFRILVKASVWSFLGLGAERLAGGGYRSAQAEGLIRAWAEVNDALGVSKPPRPRQPTRRRQTARHGGHGGILVPDDFCSPPGGVVVRAIGAFP